MVQRGKRQPRSLGMTYAAIRKKCGLSQAEMHRLLEAVQSEYPFPRSTNRERHRSRRQDEQRRRACVSLWESARGNPVFAVTHRYGVAAGAFSGVLDLASLAYAELRNSGAEKDPAPHIEELKRIAQGLDGLATRLQSICATYDAAKVKFCLEGDLNESSVVQEHLALILHIIDGFASSYKARMPVATLAK